MTNTPPTLDALAGYEHVRVAITTRCSVTCLVYPSLDSVREAKAELKRQGRELLQEASGGDVFDFGYFQFPEIGSIVEVLYLDTTKLPPPEAVISPAA